MGDILGILFWLWLASCFYWGWKDEEEGHNQWYGGAGSNDPMHD